jgi:hypothetical protein
MGSRRISLLGWPAHTPPRSGASVTAPTRAPMALHARGSVSSRETLCPRTGVKRLEDAEVCVEFEFCRVLRKRVGQGDEGRMAVFSVRDAAATLEELDEVAEQRRIAQMNLQDRSSW